MVGPKLKKGVEKGQNDNVLVKYKSRATHLLHFDAGSATQNFKLRRINQPTVALLPTRTLIIIFHNNLSIQSFIEGGPLKYTTIVSPDLQRVLEPS